MLKKLFYINLILQLFFCFDAKAEDNKSDSTKALPDSLSYATMNELVASQPLSQENFRMQKSPTGAVVRSLIIPGWGQFYVEQYWKAPLFLGAAGALTYFIIDNHNKYSTRQGRYDELFSIGDNRTSSETSEMEFLKRQKEAYRNIRDQYAMYLFGVYVIGAVDAYAGAHLFDFDVDDNLAIYLLPDPFTGSFCLNLSIKI